MEIPGGEGCHGPRNFRKVGGGGKDVVLMNFFSRPVSIFFNVVRNVSLFALSFSSHERRKNKSR